MEDGEVDLGYLPTCLPTELCGIEGKGKEWEEGGREKEGDFVCCRHHLSWLSEVHIRDAMPCHLLIHIYGGENEWEWVA
jgi:hypothetical protein